MDADQSNRPLVYDILQNDLLPPKLEDEYFKEALRVYNYQRKRVNFKFPK